MQISSRLIESLRNQNDAIRVQIYWPIIRPRESLEQYSASKGGENGSGLQNARYHKIELQKTRCPADEEIF